MFGLGKYVKWKSHGKWFGEELIKALSRIRCDMEAGVFGTAVEFSMSR